MKKALFLLLFSCFAFGQNIELLQKVQSSDSTLPTFLAEKLLPDYKSLYEEPGSDLYPSYTYLPKDASDKEMQQCKLGNNCDRAITLKYQVINSVYTLTEIIGPFDELFSLWKKEIQPDPKETRNHTYIYKDTDHKIWFNLLHRAKKDWTLRNMSDRPQPW